MNDTERLARLSLHILFILIELVSLLSNKMCEKCLEGVKMNAEKGKDKDKR